MRLKNLRNLGEIIEESAVKISDLLYDGIFYSRYELDAEKLYSRA